MSRASTTDLPVQTGPAPIVLAWRTAIAALAWWGLLAALHGDIRSRLRYFSQVTTLTVALTATASVLTFAVRSPWDRILPVPRRLDHHAVVTAMISGAAAAATWTRPRGLLERRGGVGRGGASDWVIFVAAGVRHRGSGGPP